MVARPAREQTLERIRQLPDRDLDAVGAFLDALADHNVALPGNTAPALPGLPDATPDDLRAAAVRNEARVWAARDQLYKTGISRTQAAQRLGVTPNQITNLLRDGDLLAIDGPDGLRLPAWQFDPETRRGRLDGIAQVAAVFPGQTLWLSTWITAPNPALGGRTPRQALLDGNLDQVVTVATYLGT